MKVLGGGFGVFGVSVAAIVELRAKFDGVWGFGFRFRV